MLTRHPCDYDENEEEDDEGYDHEGDNGDNKDDEETPTGVAPLKTRKTTKTPSRSGARSTADPADYLVVDFDHHPHLVVKIEGNQLLLAPMERSSFTNAVRAR